MMPLILALLLGTFIGMICWQVYRFFNVVPNEDRSFLDQPALGFRLVWPLINVIVFHFGDRFSESHKNSVMSRLKHGGVEYSLSANQFIASKWVASFIFSAFLYLILSRLNGDIYLLALFGAFAAYYYPDLWLAEVTEKRRNLILRSLPFYLDIITLSVEAGTNLTGGLTQAVQKSGDTPLRSELSRVLRDIRSGRTRSDALRDLTERAGSTALNSVVSGMIQAEKTGSSLGPILRAQADQIRNERFLKAEKKALEAPVKLLMPLVMFIFPTTVFVLGFLVLSKAIQENIITWAPLVWAYNWPG